MSLKFLSDFRYIHPPTTARKSIEWAVVLSRRLNCIGTDRRLHTVLLIARIGATGREQPKTDGGRVYEIQFTDRIHTRLGVFGY